MGDSLVCYRCGRTGSFPSKRCRCGEPLWFAADPAAAEWSRPPDPSMWRYSSFLPAGPPDGIGSSVGGTPLFRVRALSAYTGCDVWLKSEIGNPTGSFKDRGSAVGISWARDRRDWVGTVSHGNMALSMAAHAAASDLDCLVLVPEDIPAARLSTIARFEPTLLRVSGDYGRLYHDALAAGPAAGVEFVNSDTPLRVAGQKTIAFEILAERSPDAIVLPASSGGHASAIWKGLRDLEDAGLIEAAPRLYLVQAAACSPIADAYRDGRSDVTAVAAGDTIAYSIANPDPPSGNRALAAVRATDGAVTAVDDAAIEEAQTVLATRVGLHVEPSSAAALAGIGEFVGSGAIDPDDEVVVIATGSGYTEGDRPTVEPDTVSRDAVREGLCDLVAPSTAR